MLTEADLPSAEVALEICSVGPWDFEREGQLREVCQQLQLDETHLLHPFLRVLDEHEVRGRDGR